MSSSSKAKKSLPIQIIQHITANTMGGICLAILVVLCLWSPMVSITYAGIVFTLLFGHKSDLHDFIPALTMIITGFLTAASALFGYNLFAIESKKAGNRLDCGNSEHQWSIIAIMACNLLAMICCDFNRWSTFHMTFSFIASGAFLILTVGGPIVKPATEVKFMHHQAGEWICRIVPAAGPVLQATPFILHDNKADVEAPAAIKTPDTQANNTVSTTTTTIVYNTAPTSAGSDTPPMYSAALETMNNVETKQ